MKKVLTFAAAIVLFAGMANAQLGIHVGYAPQTYLSKYTYSGTTLTDTASMTGLFVGVDYNINLTGDLNVNVGVQGRYNSHSEEGTILGVTMTEKSTQMLLDIPILFNYGLSLTDALKLSVFAGPTVTYALNGKTVVTVSSNESTSDWYDDNSNIKKLDVSLTLGLNLAYNDIRLFGGYNMGLLNLTSADNTTMKGSNLFFGVGYAL